jgi:hypothetical protein
MKRPKTFKVVSLWIPLTGDGQRILHVDGRNGYTGTYHAARIPSPSEISELEVELLKTGAQTVVGDGRKFIRTQETVGKTPGKGIYKHLVYKVKYTGKCWK